MPRLLSTVAAATLIVMGSAALGQMHEGSRGGGGGGGGGGTRGHVGGGPVHMPAVGGGAVHMPAVGGRVSSDRADGGRAALGAARAPSSMEFHGRSFGTLSSDERAHWATGAWRHVMHDGVYGWWWFLDDDWFFYPDAIYPYPTYIAPLLTVQETPAVPPSQPYWYYCANPQGYYPYVEACPIGWQTVPAAPADAPPGSPPPPPVPGP